MIIPKPKHGLTVIKPSITTSPALSICCGMAINDVFGDVSWHNYMLSVIDDLVVG